jgi:hypothetical protein
MKDTNSPVAQATPNLQLKLGAASPNSPKVGGWFDGNLGGIGVPNVLLTCS